jgi:hypothetical protein
MADTLIGDANGEHFPQGHSVDVIGRGTSSRGVIGCIEGTPPSFDEPAYRLGESRKLLNFRLVAGYGGGSF